ncbi:NADH-dependent [FeFe] hydrogenase, group A6 [Pectinatus cerevisiiphilus]|uniref:NAD(P)-dependent iron-only hydrogenase catalytic subunit n=1 Tax=Pectinatus cerevisiiphilus TaxID=86956 RepID=A0A4R3KAY3_9FIRM|nr:NADH-dependent [FeFe] hydrogenase, group A6 [Pectinatus cerevisiiphilus]TCS80090.1 NAD(P)-dependent iron-only hydrogenase catalytic subunit [Pectinatus cerevisiiphilus]
MEEMIKLKINGMPVEVKKGTKILQAAQMLHIDIPHLCYHPDQRVKARCRICSVEVIGKKRLLAACATECWDGMEVFTDTKVVRDTQRGILQLIMADHEENCLTCPRNGNCVLQQLCSRFNVLRPNLTHVSEAIPVKTTNPSLVHDPEKCVKCGRCIRVCKDVQGIEAIGFAGRSTGLKVTTPYGEEFNKTDCVLCGQCTVVCPVGALVEKDDTNRVLEAVFNPHKVVIVQTAPSVRVALGDAFGLPDGSIVTKKMVSALRMIGFDKVFDTNYGADLTITEEAEELIDRLKNNKKMPMTTSCCPAWVNFMEKHYPDEIAHLSSTKSPMSIFSAVAKTQYAKQENIAPENIFSVAIMPCIAKKYEAKRPELGRGGIADTDAVITTRGLIKLIKYIGIDFCNLPESEFDNPMGESTGAGAIFGATGGVMEAALRTAYEWMTGGKPMPTLEYLPVRGFDGIKEAQVEIAGHTLKIAVVHTLKNAAFIMDKIRSGQCEYDFIEVMACPGGCVGGGGQPVTTTFAVTKKRMKALYMIDRNSKLRKSHENPYLKKLYAEFLEKPGSEKAHQLLHTHYHAREKEFDFSK